MKKMKYCVEREQKANVKQTYASNICNTSVNDLKIKRFVRLHLPTKKKLYALY
jgi:hypothetical protein